MDIKDWICCTETVEDVVTATPYAALSATLDRESARPERGTALPALWHWLYFLPLHRRSEIGPDGHAKRGGFLPPVPLPRRMWAGSQFQFGKPVRIGDAVQRTSTIESVSEKSGRTGALVFVKVRHETLTNGERDWRQTLAEDREAVLLAAKRQRTQGPLPRTSATDGRMTFRYDGQRDRRRRR
jgi:3-methylfumaryl-CoA hydratase